VTPCACCWFGIASDLSDCYMFAIRKPGELGERLVSPMQSSVTPPRDRASRLIQSREFSCRVTAGVTAGATRENVIPRKEAETSRARARNVLLAGERNMMHGCCSLQFLLPKFRTTTVWLCRCRPDRHSPCLAILSEHQAVPIHQDFQRRLHLRRDPHLWAFHQ
jgi:hypothetical protein